MIFRLVIQIALWLGVAALVLFLAAGDTSWAAGWGFLGVLGVLSLVAGLWLAWRDPVRFSEKLALPWQRTRAGRDRQLMASTAACAAFWLAAMAVDAGRFRFSLMPQPLQGVGMLLIAASVAIFALAFLANGFAATFVKFDPGQRVVSDGLYALVRHPMYAGAMLFFIGAPLLLGSWIGLALAPAFIVVLVLRALGEERVRRAELPGYADYQARVRYQFVPRVW